MHTENRQLEDREENVAQIDKKCIGLLSGMAPLTLTVCVLERALFRFLLSRKSLNHARKNVE